MTSLKPEAGSVAISLAGLFPVLRQHDIQSEVITLDDRNPSTNVDTDGFRVHRFDPNETSRLVQQADLIHLHGWNPSLNKPVAAMARKTGLPYVLSPHGELTEGRYHPIRLRDKLHRLLGENKLIRSAAALVTSNKQEADDLRSRGLHSLVKELPYGLSFSDYTSSNGSPSNLPAAPNGKCLLLLGPIDPMEGCVMLLKAMAELGSIADEWSIILAGRECGDWRKMIEAAVRRKGAQDRVLFTDAPDISVQRGWLSRASVLVAPGLHVRPTVSILQAVAMGTPVIASDCVAPNALSHLMHVCGPTRPQLQRALRSAFHRGEESLQVRANQAQEFGARRYDWSVQAQSYAEFYRSLIR